MQFFNGESRLFDAVLYVLRALGAFALARYLTRRSLRILCYHGFSLGDEHAVFPVMFMRGGTFERRLNILAARRVPVIRLDEAIERLERGAIAQGETVITFDDGWASNLIVAQPILERHGFPVCIYVTTEHLDAGTEVFNVALSYMIQRSGKDALVLRGLHPHLDGTYPLAGDRLALTLRLIKAAEEALPLPERQRSLATIAEQLGFDLAEVLGNDRFRLLSAAELQELHRRGADIELHTHTHRLPAHDFAAMAAEITRNRDRVGALLGTTPRHFCYPSGQHAPQHPQWLAKLGVVSATTCDPGLNGAGTSPLLLRRHLDSDTASDIAFEAEICGIRELARRLRDRVAGRRGATLLAQPSKTA